MSGRKYNEKMIIDHCKKQRVYVSMQMIVELRALRIFLKDRSVINGKELVYHLPIDDCPLAFTNELMMIMIIDKLIDDLRRDKNE